MRPREGAMTAEPIGWYPDRMVSAFGGLPSVSKSAGTGYDPLLAIRNRAYPQVRASVTIDMSNPIRLWHGQGD